MGLSKHEGNNSLIQQELDQLDATPVMLGNKWVKPSQCYHLSTNPAHVLYNTNCPEDLKVKVAAILSKYENNDGNSQEA